MIRLLHDHSLLPYNTFGIDVKAERFTEVVSEEALKEVLSGSQDQNRLILGGGSNLLFTRDVAGLVIRNGITGIELVEEDEASCKVRVGAGENWHQFVLYCVDQSYGGVENLSLIPGSVGASPIQNIGAYGTELKDVFEELEALDLEDLTVRTFSARDCEFGYRDSIFKRGAKGRFVITRVILRLSKNPQVNVSYGTLEQELERMGVGEVDIRAVSQAVINIRRSKLPDPEELGNAGSFFKNPVVNEAVFTRLKTENPGIKGYPLPGGEVKLAAGWLIEQAGWKGHREARCGVHERQALVLVNYGGASGEEVRRLSEKIRKDIRTRFGVELEPEVNIF